MGLSLDGLASGLDTTVLIAKLMQLEARPQVLLKATAAKAASALTDFQSLNTRLAALLEKAGKAAAPTGLQQFTASTSDASVTVKAGADAAAGSLDLTVTRVASPHVIVSAAMPSWPGSPPVLTIVRPDGTRAQVTATSDSLADIARAVDNAELGITATRVQSGTDASGTPLFRLQFASTETGAASAFQVFRGSEADVAAGTAVDVAAEAGASVIRQGQDAAVTLWAGTAAEQSITSASNTFTGLLPGVDVTVSKVTASPVGLTIGRDLEASSDTAAAFLDEVRSILTFISQKSATSKTTDATGATITNVGSFTSDSNIRGIRQALVDAIQAPIDGNSLAPLGISFSKTGELEFDAEKFAAALTDDPAHLEAAFSTIATRLGEVATRYSDKYEGQLSKQIEGKQSLIDGMDKQIEGWTRRLEQREATLKRTYAALEVAMSKLNDQSSYLASQLAGLPSWDAKSSK
ncbi:flagellar filament capping protein FliD [Agromyces sp. NPDC056379]|uniref:flagellar filament capping protein FliD n=1 Tax=unclassified Agromyces TaxID=2639701 RepID=UPI0035DEC1C5